MADDDKKNDETSEESTSEEKPKRVKKTLVGVGAVTPEQVKADAEAKAEAAADEAKDEAEAEEEPGKDALDEAVDKAEAAAERAKKAADEAKGEDFKAHDAKEEAELDEKLEPSKEVDEAAAEAKKEAERAHADAEDAKEAAKEAAKDAKEAVAAAGAGDLDAAEAAAEKAEEAAERAEADAEDAKDAAKAAIAASIAADEARLADEHTPEEPEKRPALYLAEYESADDLAHAAEKVRDAGYEKWDCHTPYPVHGLDDAMGLPPTKIGYISFAHALIGLISAILMIQYMNNWDYPINIGGKPFGVGAFPSMGPIMFELTVLLTGFGTLFGMLHLAKLPRHHHPIFESDRFDSATDDKFFISIEVGDEKFDLDKTRALLESTEPSYLELVEEEVE